MSDASKTCIRLRSGADHCTVDGCVAVVSESSNRSLVDTAAKNTVVKNSRVIEITQRTMKGKKKYFFIPIVLGVMADVATLLTTGQHCWSYIFRRF